MDPLCARVIPSCENGWVFANDTASPSVAQRRCTSCATVGVRSASSAKHGSRGHVRCCGIPPAAVVADAPPPAGARQSPSHRRAGLTCRRTGRLRPCRSARSGWWAPVMRSRSNGTCSCLSGCNAAAATADRITRVGDFPICVLSPPRKRHAPRGAPPSKSLLAHFPGLDSYLSEVDRFALDMRKRSTVPTDCRESMHGWPSPSPPPSTSRRRRPHHRAPRHRAARAPFRDPHPTHRDDGSMGPSTDISRSRTVPNNVGNTGPHSAGSHTESRPQWPADGRTPPTPWMVRGVRSVRGLPTERKPVDLAKHGGDSGGFGLRLDGVEPLVGIVAAEGRQTGFKCPLGRFRPSDRSDFSCATKCVSRYRSASG